MEGVLVQNRVGTEASERRFQPYATSNFETLHQEELLSADCIVHRENIEARAQEIIAARDRIETQYKNKNTYRDDSRTLLFEALTASGHLSVVEVSGSLEEIHAMMLSVLLNAYSDTLPEHERRRRFQEICEELTRQEVEYGIVAGRIARNTQVATISDYISGGTLSEKSAISIGYRPKNKKGMVRSSYLKDNNDGTYTRVIEQTSRSNADAIETKQFLEQEGIPVRMHRHADVAVLGTPFLHASEDGVVALHKRLDQHKGANIRHGEVSHDEQLDYDELREESYQREQAAECFIDQLASFTERLDIGLASGSITKKRHTQLLKDEIHRILQAICVMDPGYAKDCFGEKVQASYSRASDYAARGAHDQAAHIVATSEHLEETVSFCGMSITKEEAKTLGIEMNTLESLIKSGTEKWNWKKGVCRVEECPTRPGKTDVGPCSVCRGCQHEFDKGGNPTKSYRRMKRIGKTARQGAITIWSLFKKPKKEAPRFQLFELKKPKHMQSSEKHEKMVA